uniref:Sodium/potassium-transporting ATPase subunit beta n=1 Tax=Marmota marmota marmota TaxID=9994 RepID=A0A8C5ZTA1_MARMA
NFWLFFFSLHREEEEFKLIKYHYTYEWSSYIYKRLVLISFAGLILLFYLVFYGFLAALFSFTMWVMLQTLNDEVPKYRDQIPSPGLMVFPKPVTALEYTFSVSDPSSYEGYVKDLKKFLKSYSGEEQSNLKDCPDGVPFEQKGPVYTACQFPLALLQECSGIGDPDFGYSKGKPCILVKMNRVRT